MRFLKFKNLVIKGGYPSSLHYRYIPVNNITHMDYDHSLKKAIFCYNGINRIESDMSFETFEGINKMLTDDNCDSIVITD